MEQLKSDEGDKHVYKASNQTILGKNDRKAARASAALMLPVSLLAFAASGWGILDPGLYQDLLAPGTMTDALVYGSIIQDVISFPAAAVLLVSALLVFRTASRKALIIMLGLAAYFFYGYGLYAIQGQYTRLYLIYLAIVGLTIYGLIYGASGLIQEAPSAHLPRSLRNAVSLFIVLILAILMPAWIARILPDIARRIPGEVYGVFLLDLAVVFPALAIIVFMVMKGRPAGYVLAGPALVKTFTLCLSVALGEWLKPAYGFYPDPAMIVMFSVLTLISALLGILYFARIRLDSKEMTPSGRATRHNRLEEAP